ncbi:MAG: hypothetical protein ABR520_05280 [Mycobacteriales bacterium]|nr:hypothetical protein [Frankia sp.]
MSSALVYARDIGPLPVAIWFAIACALVLLVTIALGVSAGRRDADRSGPTNRR